jgi:hypothetical protein
MNHKFRERMQNNRPGPSERSVCLVEYRKNSLNAHELNVSIGTTVTVNNLQYADIIAAKSDIDKSDGCLYVTK